MRFYCIISQVRAFFLQEDIKVHGKITREIIYHLVVVLNG